jgi:hypothetical protein
MRPQYREQPGNDLSIGARFLYGENLASRKPGCRGAAALDMIERSGEVEDRCGGAPGPCRKIEEGLIVHSR